MNDHSEYGKRKQKKPFNLLSGIGIGICLGVAYSLIFDNPALGIALGICFGACAGAGVFSQKKKDENDREN